jgi:glycosyltransferase involved in cell wall biosynthesis
MVAGHNFIYFGPEKWTGLWRNRHQLMSRFAKDNKVLYVEPHRKLKKTRAKLAKGELQLQAFIKDLSKNRVALTNENMLIYHSPLYAPVSDRFPLNKLTRYFWRIILRKTLVKMEFHDPIIWVSRPSMIDLIDGFGKKMLIYHVVDEYQAYFGNSVSDEDQKNKTERRMLKKADLVLVVSQKLYDTKKPINPNTHLVSNAVDFYAYDEALCSEKPQPKELAELPSPKIGYSGLIAAKLNFKLLRDMAISHPEWSIILLGAIDYRHCSEDLNLLKKMKNIYFIKRKNIKDVPYYIKALDVCIAPYKINRHSQNMSPLKIYDYMACGKPIVSTNFPAAQMYKELIYIACTESEFTPLVEKALNEDNINSIKKRRHVASMNTWDDRVKQISMLIHSTLHKLQKTSTQ